MWHVFVIAVSLCLFMFVLNLVLNLRALRSRSSIRWP
jgi:cell division protein FtsX